MALEAVQAQAGHLSIESTRVYLHLANHWLAGEYRRATAPIDADAAAAEMLAAQEAAGLHRETGHVPADCPRRLEAKNALNRTGALVAASLRRGGVI